jgi:hypothetical protein
MNWYALVFGPYYYAGYGKMSKGIVMALIGSLPITAIFVNVYAAIKANKDLPVGKQEFNWKDCLITLAIGLSSTATVYFAIAYFK